MLADLIAKAEPRHGPADLPHQPLDADAIEEGWRATFNR
jgi:hypothetical protein